MTSQAAKEMSQKKKEDRNEKRKEIGITQRNGNSVSPFPPVKEAKRCEQQIAK